MRRHLAGGRLNRVFRSCLAAGGVLVARLSVLDPALAASTSVTISPPTQVVQPGAQFTADVVLATDAPTLGLQLGLSYDPSLIHVDKVTDGPFYLDWAKGNGGSASSLIPFRPDNAAGKVSIGAITVLNVKPPLGATGTGAVLHLQLSAQPGASGQATITLEKVAVSKPEGLPIPNVSTAGAVVAVGGNVDPASLSAPGVVTAESIQTAPSNVHFIGGGSAGGGAASEPAPAAPPQAPPAAAPAQPPPAAALAQAPPAAAPAAPGAQPVEGAAPVPAQPAQVAAAAPTGAQVSQQAPGGGAAPPGAQAPAQNALPAGQAAQQAAAQSVPGGALAPPVSGGVPPAGGAPAAAGGVPQPVPLPAGQAYQPQPPGTGGNQALAARALGAQAPVAPAAGPARAPAASTPITPPRVSTGVFIPWEVLAGIGGGLVAAGLVLYAFRSRQEPLP